MKISSICSYYALKLIAVSLLAIILPFISACSSSESEAVFEDYDAADFTHPTIIDNEWLPLKPGRQWIFEGTTTEDGETFSHRIEFTVTDLTKEIEGVQTVVALLADFSDNVLVEKEIAFYAQDDNGDVWFFGEYPEEYEDGELVKTPTWLAGIEEAKAGVKMRAKPQLGGPNYYQGWGPRVDWSDFGKVDKTGEKTCVPVNCYEDVLVIAESSLGEEKAFQLKYYARGIGEVRVGWRGDDATQEELELVKFTQLDPQDLTKIHMEAIELESRAYQTSPDVYALSVPLSDGTGNGSPISPAPQPIKTAANEVQKISEDEVVRIALETVPGEVTDVDIEKKFGANRYVIEVVAKDDGTETDVIIDMETGKVLGVEK